MNQTQQQRLNEAVLEIARLAAKLAAQEAALAENPPHKVVKFDAKGKPVCASDCYACERRGLQERILFTSDYESLRLQLYDLSAAQEAREQQAFEAGWHSGQHADSQTATECAEAYATYRPPPPSHGGRDD